MTMLPTVAQNATNLELYVECLYFPILLSDLIVKVVYMHAHCLLFLQPLLEHLDGGLAHTQLLLQQISMLRQVSHTSLVGLLRLDQLAQQLV